MIKKILNKKLSEELIIKKFLRRLNFNKIGTYNFKNDAAYLKINKNKKIVITTDSISENIDFFKNDDPKSIASKIITTNLSDLSAMGVNPYSYTLNLFLPNYIDYNWLRVFTAELLKIQKKYNFYLLGGDLSKSNKLQISSTFFGFQKYNNIVTRNSINLNHDIWITGNLGDSYIGLQILKKKLDIKNKKIKNYFLNKYFFPKPCMIGSQLIKYASSITDISDGFIGDLKKMLNNYYGAKINLHNIPISFNMRKLIKNNIILKKSILNTGDNYDLIVIASKKNRNKIINISRKNKIKCSLVGEVIGKIQILDDSNNSLNITKEFDHFR